MKIVIAMFTAIMMIGIAYAYIDGLGYVKVDDKPVPLKTIKPLTTVG